MRAAALVGLALLAGLFVAATAAADTKAPAGPVILTVAGETSDANRPGYDARKDVFFGYHEQTFDRAIEFDRAMLEGLGVREISISYKDWGGAIAFSGPRLADVLKAAGCDGSKLFTMALDGFATEIPASEVAAHDWVVSTRADGRPHAIGGRGPLWLVFDPPGERAATEEEENMWPWALFFIRCG